MKQVKNIICAKENISLTVFAAIMFSYHILIRPTFGDDINIFGKTLVEGSGYLESLAGFLTMRWNSCSPRTVIDTILFVLANIPPFFWKIADTGIWVLCAWSLDRIVGFKNQAAGRWCAVLLVLQFPFFYVSTAGWMATTVNYLWPLSLGLFSCTLITMVCREERISVPYYILALLATVVAANHEQMCMVLTGIYGCTFLFVLFRKKKTKLLLPPLAVSLIELIRILSCPGISARFDMEIGKWFPEYRMFNLFDRLNLGWLNLLNQAVMKINMVFLAFLVIIAVGVWKKYHDPIIRGLALYPVVLTFLWNWNIVGLIYDNFVHVFHSLALVQVYNWDSSMNYVAIALLTAMAVIVVELLLLCFDSWGERLAVLAILGLGAGSVIGMGLSPTIYISGDRTFIFFYFSLLLISLLLVEKLGLIAENGILLGKPVKIGASMFTAFAVANSIIYIFSRY